MDTPELQKLIKELTKKYSWSQEQLSNVLYVNIHEDDDEAAMKKFASALKKQLNRSTTSPEVLQSYLDIMIQDPKFKTVSMIYPKPIPTTVLDDVLVKGLAAISKKILKNL